MVELGWHDHYDLVQLEPLHHLTNMFSNHKSNILARSKKKLIINRVWIDVM